MTRPLHEIAREIHADMAAQSPGLRPAVKFSAAWPYLEALTQLEDTSGQYYADSARSVVLYFLCNVSTWRGETARRIKAELKEMAK